MILDYRAFDTFGESTVLFVAVAAVVMLMKRSMNKKDEDGERLVARETEIDKKDQNLVLKYGAMILVPFVILFGVYVIFKRTYFSRWWIFRRCHYRRWSDAVCPCFWARKNIKSHQLSFFHDYHRLCAFDVCRL